MKQLLQNLKNGETSLVESPSPKEKSQHIIISTNKSLISPGTERMLVNFGKSNYINKAKQQPDKVKMVLDKIKTDGLATTIDAVKSKLDQPLPLGYSNVGIVNSCSQDVEGFSPGDRVVSNGSHADVVRVPKNLCAKIPDNVKDEEAAFTVVASIGLQGIRLAKPTLGEYFVVTGVGLIGLIVVQLLRAQGCNVLAIDYDDDKLKIAKKFGAKICNPNNGEDPVKAGLAFTKGNGVDGVIITAASDSNEPVSHAAKMSRKRGRIILVGVVGLDLSRADFYEKELTFQVSCSYGPGRYDSDYEIKGNDYPLGFVRWTEQRNFVAVLDMMSNGKLDVTPLITHRFNFEDAEDAYNILTEDKSALGIMLNYTNSIEKRFKKTIKLKKTVSQNNEDKVSIGFIGAGNYASRILIPAFKKSDLTLHTIASSGGVNGVISGKKFGFLNSTTDATNMMKNEDINTIVIATKHNSHADFIIQSIKNKKNIFVEKPLALTTDEVEKIDKEVCLFIKKNGFHPRIMVGFNRRFSPQIKKMKKMLSLVEEPKSFIMTMNAGYIPKNHWTQDNSLGGGRIIGEACHYIDLMRFLAGHKIISVQARKMGENKSTETINDKASIILGFEDGSFGSINYLSNGSNSFPKERVEVFTSGKVIQINNFIKMSGYGWKGFSKYNLWRQDKGQDNCTKAFVDSILKGGSSPIPYNEIIEVANVSIEVDNILKNQNN